nr:synaptic vesicle glycoprotein 2A-like isoform X2 [Halyomorpha halys]
MFPRYRQVAQAELDNTEGEADLETALSKCGFGIFNIALLLLSFPASTTSAFETGSMSYVIPAASNDLGLTPKDKAMLQSASFAGMMASGFLWGFISDALGRKKLLVLGFLLNGTLNILAGIFPILSLMIVFKFLAGFMFVQIITLLVYFILHNLGTCGEGRPIALFLVIRNTVNFLISFILDLLKCNNGIP